MSNTADSVWNKMLEVFPGGVNSPVRACQAVNMSPIVFKKGKGAYIESIEGDKYLDYVGSWGPLILGHASKKVLKEVKNAIFNGLSFGAPCLAEMKLAQTIIQAVPSIEKIRMVNSGTEAVMSAIRLARAFTKRNKIIKFEGCYHGHADFLLAQAGSGLATYETQGAVGVPSSMVQNTITVPYNSQEAIENVFKTYNSDIAAVILEPIAANMGVVFPDKDFLTKILNLSKENKSLIIFDEVITGFRFCFGCVQDEFKISPDLTILGKIIGGGMPVGAFGGRKEIMDMLSPKGDVYQAGTLSGNPVAMTAGYQTLKMLKETNPYKSLEKKGLLLKEGIKKALNRKGIEYSLNSKGSIGSIFFMQEEVKDYQDVKKSDNDLFIKLYQGLRERNILIAPSPYEAYFISTAHKKSDIESTVDAVGQIFD